EYEWRLRWTRTNGREPIWDGSRLPGGTFVLEAEQGFGDTIQLMRYAPLVAERSGARVLLACPKALQRLARSVRDVADVCDVAQDVSGAHYIPLSSVPRIFGTTIETIPATLPYIFPPPELIKQWRERIGSVDGRRIGLAWSGNPAQRENRWRS